MFFENSNIEVIAERTYNRKIIADSTRIALFMNENENSLQNDGTEKQIKVKINWFVVQWAVGVRDTRNSFIRIIFFVII